MSIKDKLTALLSSLRPQNPQPQEPEAAPQAPVQRPAPAAAFSGPLAVELPPDHPIHQLYELRRQESGPLPPVRLFLDPDGILPEELVRRETGRLETFLSQICAARLREAGGKKKAKDSGKKAGEEGGEALPSLDALPCFFLSADKLYAWVLTLPPVRGGAELSRGALRRAMDMEKLAYGIDEGAVDRLPHDSEKYFHLFLIAQGKPAFDGKNGNIVEHFPRVVERTLQADEYNQVDYTALNLIHNVKEGEEICRLILPTEGEPGRTVLDQVIPAKGGRAVPLPKGRNTEISEDGVSLVASIAGHVEFTGQSFQVKPVLDVPENVDFSTGDIHFLGDVNIAGDVLSGFSVQARGSIHVGGVLEAGCTVEAGGDLVVVKGIWGDGSTVIRARRSVFSKYIENAEISARENLQADCIVNGSIYAGGQVQVNSGRGAIMGGRVWAGKRVLAKTVGSPAECRTAIVLGGMPCATFERDRLRREMRDLQAEQERLEGQPGSQARSSLLQKAQARISGVEIKLKHAEAELEETGWSLEDENQGRLECGVAYSGTEIISGSQVLRLRTESRQCVATVLNGEIVLM